jgi:hypothetical protein
VIIATTKTKRINRRFPDRCLPAIVAVGSSLAAVPAGALELGELTVQSRLGQPLRASIAYALAPSEQLSDYCITMRPGPSVSGLPGFGAASVSVANGVIMLTGKTPVREPMVSAHVVVNCPYTANLSREYLLFIDPLTSTDTTIYQGTAVTQQASPQAEPIVVAPAAVGRPVAAVSSEPVVRDIATSTRYQVQPGESLSEITQRIQNRPVGLWPAVNAIFAANPSAFINNDPNNLMAGSWLSIPSFDGSAAVVAGVEATAVEGGPADAISEAYEPSPVAEMPQPSEALAVPEPQPDASETSPAEVILDDLADSGVAAGNLQPGDIILDAELPGPTTTSSSPNVATAIITTNRSNDNAAASPSWLAWLAGSGIAIIFGLLMFGRRLRDRSGTSPGAALADQQPQRRFSDTNSSNTESIETLEVDYSIADESPTEENLVLDADLVMGTGLSESSDSNISQDFGFAATTELDIELPFDADAAVADETEVADGTDMLPPLRTDEHSILESEILPEVDDDDYDMSVIVDATKMPRPEDVTERDLKAVEVATDDASMIAPNYTINKQVDYQVLEQDYEDEMTTTQALNLEISRAAAELTARMETEADDDAGDETSALPLATVTELDITAQMPTRNDEISDLDDTGINEAITLNTAADDETVEMPAETGKTG